MSTQPTTASNGAGPSASGYLEFEKPLFRIQCEIEELREQQRESSRDFSKDIEQMTVRLRSMTKRLYSHLTAWETVLVARHPRRPILSDYIRMFVRDYCELAGDRCFGDDKAISAGFGRIGPHKVMLVGHNKGKDTKERIACNFGCAHPEGYRKALQKMRLAEKYGLPVVCLVDTPGAYPGVGSEERGISQAIAVNMMEMSRLRCPIICVVIGEGGSGGALGIGVGDRVAMLEHAYYSVISPEGCAAILWRTGEQRQRAAESLRLTAKELKRLGIIDQILPEPLGGAHRDPETTAASLEAYITGSLRELKRFKTDTVLRKRYDRVRNLGGFFESAKAKARSRTRKVAAGSPSLPPGATRPTRAGGRTAARLAEKG
jgi:acetyl-CoA carboxylase carboxyl transferase subunit alpha